MQIKGTLWWNTEGDGIYEATVDFDDEVENPQSALALLEARVNELLDRS